MQEDVKRLQEINAALYAALASWVRYMESLDSDDEFDPLRDARQLYHGRRMAASREALAKADGR